MVLPDDDAALAAVFALCLFVRAAVGLSGYSGESAPPMYGDFEAQRHWMEVTVNLPPAAWYMDGLDNDLQYWGLDYPPLSAHLSWLLGHAARRLGHPELVALHASRGLETPATRAYMRNTVLASDALVFFPAVAAVVRASAPRGSRLAFALQLLAVPALVLVDHGHFQYNCVSLGLALWAAHAAMAGRPLACCAAFSLALNFKQMSLYLAPAFFCYLLAGCLGAATARGRVAAVARLGAAVLLTFAACWAPLLRPASTAPEAALAVLRRVFPVERHLYEDKVANIWCTLALLPPLKLKALLPIGALLRVALGSTALALAPPCALLLARPSRLGFLLCATGCCLAFFLCSYQVHEKHILLPLLPASLLAPRQPALFGWLSAAATFSLFPLLKRDGLALPYACCQAAALALALGPLPSPAQWALPRAARAAMCLSLCGMLVLHLLEASLAPPARYPDLHSVAFAAYSCAHFVAAYLGALLWQWRARDTEPRHTPFEPGTDYELAPRAKRA
jgi:alpha-1,3-glucosyltransferase